MAAIAGATTTSPRAVRRIASTTSSGSMSFSRKPRTPARNARPRSSCESLIVSTTTGVSTPSARSRASRAWPSTGSMRRSMIARSGRSSRSRRTASSALPVVPRTVMPARACSSSDRPRRHSAWSSIRTTFRGFAHASVPGSGSATGKGELDPRPAAGGIGDDQPAAEPARALAHDGKTVVPGRVGVEGAVVRRDADAVVLDGDHVLAAAAIEDERRAAGARVPRDVGERLLDDVEHLDLPLRRDAELRHAVGERQRDAGPVGKALADLAQRVHEAAGIHLAAEVGDQLAQPAVRVAERVVDVAPVLERARLVAAADRVAQQAHPHPHVGQPLRQRVVHLAGQHLPLGAQPDPQVLAGEARVVERDPDQVAGGLQQRRHRRRQRAFGREQQVQHADRPVLVAQRHRHDVLADQSQRARRDALVVPAELAFHAGAVGAARLVAGVAPRRQRVAVVVEGDVAADGDRRLQPRRVLAVDAQRRRIGAGQPHDGGEHRLEHRAEVGRRRDGRGRRRVARALAPAPRAAIRGRRGLSARRRSKDCCDNGFLHRFGGPARRRSRLPTGPVHFRTDYGAGVAPAQQTRHRNRAGAHPPRAGEHHPSGLSPPHPGYGQRGP